jgi:nucleotide-binding universal stress UspA family protein
MKNILLLIGPMTGEEARLQAALDVVRAVSAHLTCLDPIELPALVSVSYETAGAAAVVLETAQSHEAAHRQTIEARLAQEGVSWDWIDEMGNASYIIHARDALADLIVVNTQFGEFDWSELPLPVTDVILRSGRPVLAVPSQVRGFDVGGHAVVAWNGSRPAANALRAAVPLLKLASAVTLVQSGETSGPSVEEAASYLSRYDIQAEVERARYAEAQVADFILTVCQNRKAGLLVAGAYGHSRLIETLLGGVTKALLAKSPVPLLLAH